MPSGEIQVCTLAFVYSSARTNKRASKYGINKDVSLLGHIEWAMQWDLRPKKKKRERGDSLFSLFLRKLK